MVAEGVDQGAGRLAGPGGFQGGQGAVGGTADNVAEALATADGAIVSTSLMRKDAAPGDLLLWDADKSRAFMDRALAALPA